MVNLCGWMKTSCLMISSGGFAGDLDLDLGWYSYGFL